jgi:hypothetical protein
MRKILLPAASVTDRLVWAHERVTRRIRPNNATRFPDVRYLLRVEGVER